MLDFPRGFGDVNCSPHTDFGREPEGHFGESGAGDVVERKEDGGPFLDPDFLIVRFPF